MAKSVLLLLACSLSLVAHAMADSPKAIDIPAGNLVPALEALQKQAAVELVYRAEQLKEFHTGGVKGTYTAHDAVKLLLKGTPLELRTDPSGAMLIAPALAHSTSSTSATQESGQDEPGREGKSNSSRTFQLAQATPGQAAGTGPVESPQRQKQSSDVPIQEVIVTAQKKSERLQDVPVPVTAISGITLVDSGQLRIEDYYSRIPGLSLTSDGLFGSQSLAIRGITTGPGANPTVGIVVDDVPYGGTSTITQSDNIPDIDPYDLARVEVLRGPQGTLYGAASMGGLLKFVTIDPDTSGVSGRLQAGTQGVQNGAQLGYNVRGSVNLPVNDTLAIRTSAFTREEPGYIDDPAIPREGVNEERVSGGRVAALWHLSDSASLKLSALYQDDRADGSSDVDKPVNGYAGPPLGDLQQSRLPGTGGFDKTLQAYSATISARIGSADLTAVTGYNVNDVSSVFDYTYLLGQGLTLPNFGVTGTPLPYHDLTRKINQEIRVSFPTGPNLDWVVGAFFTHEHNENVQRFEAVDPVTDQLVSSWFKADATGTYTEYAIFTTATYRFNDRFDIQLGGRESQIQGSESEVDSGRLDILGETNGITPEQDYKKYAFTYLFTPRYRFTQDWMVYMRLASGYRAGGPNNGAAAFGLPASFGPDKTQNYEIGAKGDFLDHSVSVDASLYYIDWTDIQVSGVDPNSGFGYVANANRAKSEGVELSIVARPLTGLTVSSWVAFDDAVLTQPFPSQSLSYGVAGDRLPTSSRISGNLSVDQRFPIKSDLTGFVAGALSYTGNREGTFASAFDSLHQREEYGGYARVDARLGAEFNAWTFEFYGNNLADRRGVLAGGLGYFPPFAFLYIQPRTIGLTVSRTFR